MKCLEYKDLNYGHVNDIDVKNRVVVGYLSKFDNVDKSKDVMTKGAFAKTLNERRNDIFFLNHHDFKQPHGKFSVLKEDTKGLYFESEPLIDTTYSNDVLKLYEAGIIDKHSIGFIRQKERKDFVNGQTVTLINEVALYEGSNVTLADNDQAGFLGLKSLTPAELEIKASKIIKYMRNGDVTDETFKLLEIGLLQLQANAFQLGKKALNTFEPSDDTQTEIKPLIDTIKNFNI